MSTLLILCDEQGNTTGYAGWEDAHRAPGHLHRAFSAFVFRKNRSELLIQQRSASKPLFGLIWANTCCSHPRKDEGDIEQIGAARLEQELGFTCPLTVHSSFVYRAEDPNGKGVEHEYDTILIGHINGDVSVHANPKEVADWKWVSMEQLKQEVKQTPDIFAPWFPLALEKIFSQ